MPADELRKAVGGLMGQAKSDLAELVAFKSVADPKQYAAEECEKAESDSAMQECARKCRECERSCREMVRSMQTTAAPRSR